MPECWKDVKGNLKRLLELYFCYRRNVVLLISDAQHTVSKQWGCNGWWGSMLRRVRNCRFIIIIIFTNANTLHKNL